MRYLLCIAALVLASCGTPPNPTIVYRVTGAGTADIVYIDTNGTRHEEKSQPLPWEYRYELRKVTAILVQATNGTGVLSCTVEDSSKPGGAVVEDSGETATCSYIRM